MTGGEGGGKLKEGGTCMESRGQGTMWYKVSSVGAGCL